MVSYFRRNVWPLIAMACMLFVWACGGDGGGGGTMDPATTGTLRVTVSVDGGARSGLTVSLFEPGAGTATTSTNTGADGRATFANLEPGSYEVEVTIDAGLALAPDQDAREGAAVVAGETANITYTLVDSFTGETVEARDNLTFSQPNLVITAGTAVRWVNVGIMLHTVTPDGHSEWTAANLGSNGSTFMHTFDTPGVYEYYCEPHELDGMTGTVTVN
jgi:plastocyanin